MTRVLLSMAVSTHPENLRTSWGFFSAASLSICIGSVHGFASSVISIFFVNFSFQVS